MADYETLSDLVGTLEQVERHETHPASLIEAVRERLQVVEPRVHAYRALDPGFGEAPIRPGPLAGVPLGVKDLIDVRGLPTEGGSPAYHWVPKRHAPVVGRLVRAGAVVVGKTHTRELAFGITCPSTGNPWDLSRTPGGSSGGSAAALAAGLAWAALGTDTAGSIRIPAALCGVVGLKPTHGRLSVNGVMALSWTYDAVGPMARSVRDVARLYAVLTRAKSDANPGRPMKIRVPEGYLAGFLSESVAGDFEQAVELFRQKGIASEAVEMEPFSVWTRLFRAVRLPEAYLYHKPMLETEASERLGEAGLKERLVAGAAVPAYTYIDTLREREDIRARWLRRIRPGEVIVLPTVPVTAPRADEDPVEVQGTPHDLWETVVRCTLPWSVLGWPAITVPMGLAGGLPTALQIVGRPGTERMVLAAALFYEAERGLFPYPSLT